MATRLATQRNFITVIPATTSSPATAASVTTDPSDKGGAIQKTNTESGDSGNGTRQVEVATVSVASTATGMAARPSSSSQLPTIAITSAMKNGSAKGTLMSTNLLASNSNIMNLLGSTNGLSLQQIIQQQKKIVINTNGTLIDLVPLNDDSESAEPKPDEKLLDGSTVNDSVESGNSSEATVEETTQVAVVQSQSPGSGTPQYITVTVPHHLPGEWENPKTEICSESGWQKDDFSLFTATTVVTTSEASCRVKRRSIWAK
uniref:Uncharacterized protein n=1 Tax=Anopheles culicifacies TaxID=139723 RepID=A0A182M594_9DIPT